MRRLVLFSFLMLAFVPFFAHAQSKEFEVDTDGTLLTSLQSYFKLEDVTDFYGGDDLTNTGSVTFVAGKVNNAAQFGTALNKYLSVLSDMSVTGGAISVSGWFQITTAPASNVQQYVFWQSSNTNHNAFFLRYWNDAGTFKLRAGRDGLVRNDIIVTTTLSTGTWYHFAFTFDGSTTQLWLNGSSLGTASNSGNGGDTNIKTAFSLGAGFYNLSVEDPIKGLVDEVGVWAKKLSNQEVADLYNGSSGQTMIEVFPPSSSSTIQVINSPSPTGFILVVSLLLGLIFFIWTSRTKTL